jgi:hypothetical protein
MSTSSFSDANAAAGRGPMRVARVGPRYRINGGPQASCGINYVSEADKVDMREGWEELQIDAAPTVKPMFQGLAVPGSAERSMLELWTYLKTPNTPFFHYYEGAMFKVKNREWIRWEHDILERYTDLWTCQRDVFKTRRDVLFMYPAGHVTPLQCERPLCLAQQIYVFEGEVSAVRLACCKMLNVCIDI